MLPVVLWRFVVGIRFQHSLDQMMSFFFQFLPCPIFPRVEALALLVVYRLRRRWTTRQHITPNVAHQIELIEWVINVAVSVNAISQYVQKIGISYFMCREDKRMLSRVDGCLFYIWKISIFSIRKNASFVCMEPHVYIKSRSCTS